MSKKDKKTKEKGKKGDGKVESNEIAEDTIEPFALVDTDSTAVQEITQFQVDDEGELLGDPETYRDVTEYNNEILEDDSKTDSEKLAAGLDLLTRFHAQSNRVWNGIQGAFADYAIEKGKILNILKTLVKEQKGKWEVWASTNIKFMSERTRQNYMRLAERDDAHQYSFLGLERLNLLISVTKDSDSADPIGDLLTKYGIVFDPEQDVVFSEFKSQVDAALAAERIENAKVNVDFNKIAKLVSIGTKIDNSLIKNLARIQKSEGDPNKHLTLLFMNQGSEEALFESEKKVEGFGKLVSRIKSVMDAIMKKTDLLRQVEENLIESLEEKLSQFKEEFNKQ